MLYSGPSPVNYNFRKHNGLAAFAKERGLTYLDLNLEELGSTGKQIRRIREII